MNSPKSTNSYSQHYHSTLSSTDLSPTSSSCENYEHIDGQHPKLDVHGDVWTNLRRRSWNLMQKMNESLREDLRATHDAFYRNLLMKQESNDILLKDAGYRTAKAKLNSIKLRRTYLERKDLAIMRLNRYRSQLLREDNNASDDNRLYVFDLCLSEKKKKKRKQEKSRIEERSVRKESLTNNSLISSSRKSSFTTTATTLTSGMSIRTNSTKSRSPSSTRSSYSKSNDLRLPRIYGSYETKRPSLKDVKKLNILRYR
ncbi:hypothetical protein SNEBB_007416 [Seison nebaliae]|nr:hypothetical protein SNEBB_007416 [Seison nebaliae]